MDEEVAITLPLDLVEALVAASSKRKRYLTAFQRAALGLVEREIAEVKQMKGTDHGS